MVHETRTKIFDDSTCFFTKDGSLIHIKIELYNLVDHFLKDATKNSCQLLLWGPENVKLDSLSLPDLQ